MAKSIIVYGRDLKQMRKYAERIMKHLGMKRNEGWGVSRSSFKIPAQDTVVFFEWALSEVPQIKNGHKAVSFEEVAKQINDSIPLTDWQSGSPPMVGEWNASRWGDLQNRMWWHGKTWSSSYSPEQSEDQRNRLAKEPNNGGISRHEIQWRGLSEEPILVKP